MTDKVTTYLEEQPWKKEVQSHTPEVERNYTTYNIIKSIFVNKFKNFFVE